jgi:hypothetical protein
MSTHFGEDMARKELPITRTRPSILQSFGGSAVSNHELDEF